MPVLETSRQPSSSASAAFVDAEDIWRSAVPSVASSSRHSTVVIPPRFPPPRGVARLLSALRFQLPGMRKGWKGYRDHAVPGSLPDQHPPPPASPPHPHPHPQFHTPNCGSSSSTPTSSTSSSPSKNARYRRRRARPRQVAAITHRATAIPDSHGESPSGSRRTPSPHPDCMSSSRYIDRGIGTTPLYPPPASSDFHAAPSAILPTSMHFSSHRSASASRREEDLANTKPAQPEIFRVFSFDGELVYVDAGKPYEEAIRLTRRAFWRLRDIDTAHIQFFLACGPDERARVPEDAWPGIIRRTRSLDRIYVQLVRIEDTSKTAAGDVVALDARGDCQPEYRLEVNA